MNPIKFISISLVGMLFLSFRPSIYPVYITGHIRSDPKEASFDSSYLIIYVKGNGKVLARSTSDKLGNFKMTFLPGDEKSFDFFCTGAGIDSIFLKSFVSFESDEPDITFYFPAKRSTNKLGQITCPKCVKADKVYRIVYGDGIPFKRIITNGDTVYTPIYKGKYNAGTCVDGVAKYYCGRDKIKF